MLTTCNRGGNHRVRRGRQQANARGVLYLGLSDGKSFPMSPRPAAPERVDHRHALSDVCIRMPVQARGVADGQHRRGSGSRPALNRGTIVIQFRPSTWRAASCSLINAYTTPRSSGVVKLMLPARPGPRSPAWPVARHAAGRPSSPTSRRRRPLDAPARAARYAKACGVWGDDARAVEAARTRRFCLPLVSAAIA